MAASAKEKRVSICKTLSLYLSLSLSVCLSLCLSLLSGPLFKSREEEEKVGNKMSFSESN
jgi:hypothetical protein